MPNTASAKKRVRQSLKRTLRNRVRKERLKKVIKSFNSTLTTKDEAKIGDALRLSSKALDKAKGKGFIHKNTANRKKSRLAKAANRALKPQA